MINRDGLVAEYLFDSNADDSSGSGHHGVVHGATLTSDRFARENHAYAFDGIDDYIEVSPPPSLSSEAMTLSVWARYEPRDFRGYTNCIVAQDDGNDDDQSRRVFQLSTEGGHIIWHRMIGSRDPMCRTRVRPGIWYHMVAVHDHGSNKLYVDGVLHDSVDHGIWTHSDQPLHIGRKGTSEPYFFFKGTIDDVRLFNRALHENEVRLLLSEGDWKPKPEAISVSDRDPVGGRWGQDGVVFLHLFYDGDRTVTGRIMAGQPDNMAPISRGIFERETSHLLLEGTATDPRNGEPVTWSIEGMVNEGDVSVCARFNDFQGNFNLTRQGTHIRRTRRSLRSHLGAIAYDFRRLINGSSTR